VIVTNTAGAVTSSVANVAVYASKAANMAIHGAGSVTVSGVPGYSYEVDGSTNLTTWIPLVTNTAPFTFTDTNTNQFNYRFYRSTCLQ
jgi:hypothetical protein